MSVMEESSNQNSTIRAPLNDILGSKGHVQVLRQLCASDNAMSHSELLERTGLSRQGVYDVVRRLEKTGIISYVGSGKQQQVSLRKEHPLAEMISRLLNAEQKRFDDLVQRLKQEIEKLEFEPKSAWIFGPVARKSDQYGDPLQLALLGRVQTVDQMVEDLRNQIYDGEIEKQYDVTIELKPVTLADLHINFENGDQDIIPVWGPDPQYYLQESDEEGGDQRLHRELEQESLADSRAWSKLLKSNPEIIKRTINYLEERIPQTKTGEKHELKEWKHILESMSFQRLKKFLESDTERSTRLRQSLPFWPVLKEEERKKLEKIKSTNTASDE